MSNHYREMQRKYEHALDRMYELFKFGRDREISMESKLNQIKEICNRSRTEDDCKVALIADIVSNDRNGGNGI